MTDDRPDTGQPLDPDDLARPAVIARRLGISRARFYEYATSRRKPNTGFPEPALRLDGGDLYRISEVEAWFHANR